MAGDSRYDGAEAPASDPQHPVRPKVLRPLPLADEARPVPARMVNEVLYCERLMYLEYVQGEWADNHFTTDGHFVHRRADGKPRALRKPPAAKRSTSEKSGGAKQRGDANDSREADGDAASDEVSDDGEKPYTARSVWLTSEELGLTGKIDIVEDDARGSVVPVEYKRGSKPDLPEGAYLPERAQVCAQVLLLREHGYRCTHGEIYFAADRRRVPIEIDADLEQTTRWAIQRVRELAEAGNLPDPLVDSPKCNGCSLVGICLPDEVVHLREGDPFLTDEELAPDLEGPMEADPAGLAGDGGGSADEAVTDEAERSLRRLHPARDERLPLHVQAQGARIGLSGERLIVRQRKAPAVEARLSNTSQVNVFGNVQVSSQAMRTLLQRNIPLAYFTYGGWYVGRLVGHDHKNVELRLAQYAAATDPGFCLRIARRLVRTKILNCRTLLRRNAEAPDATALFELKQLARKALDAASLESLLGIEGTAARAYFGQMATMLKVQADDDGDHADGDWSFDWTGRNRRPPRDPLNALLSFCYALLTKDFAVTLASVGLDAQLGFYHQPRFGRPALALDLMEEFRPLIADSVVISAVNNGAIRTGDFIRSAGGVALTDHGRKRLLGAYERRMDHLVTHPVFGYRISYRRVLEVQARLLSRHLLGELPDYPEFRTR